MGMLRTRLYAMTDATGAPRKPMRHLSGPCTSSQLRNMLTGDAIANASAGPFMTVRENEQDSKA